MRERPLLTVGLAIVLLIVLTAAIAPLLPLKDPNITAPARRLAGVGVSGYVLGSDQLGRDLLSRLVWGARVSMVVAAIAAVVAFVVGGTIGLLAGFYGRLVDNVLMRLIDILMAFPYVLLAIALVAALGPGLLNALIAIAIVNISFYARGVRAAVMVVRHAAFIEASRAIGASDVRILFREVLPTDLERRRADRRNRRSQLHRPGRPATNGRPGHDAGRRTPVHDDRAARRRHPRRSGAGPGLGPEHGRRRPARYARSNAGAHHPLDPTRLG